MQNAQYPFALTDSSPSAPWNQEPSEPAYFTFYIEPDQFDQSDAGYKAAMHAGVDFHFYTMAEAKVVARMVAAIVGKPVEIDGFAYEADGTRLRDCDFKETVSLS